MMFCRCQAHGIAIHVRMMGSHADSVGAIVQLSQPIPKTVREMVGRRNEHVCIVTCQQYSNRL